MKNPLARQTLGVCFCFFWSTWTAGAQISVTASEAVAGARLPNGSDLSVTIPGWDLNGGNAIVVLFSAEGAGEFSAVFAGEELTVIGAFSGERHYSGIAYLLDPSATVGDVVIDAVNAGGSRMSHAYSVVSLANVGALAGSDVRTSNGDLSYTTIQDGGYVLGSGVNNSFNYSPPVTVSGNPDVDLINQAVDGNCTVLHVHGEVSETGSYDDFYSGSLLAAATVAFESSGVAAPADLEVTSISRSGGIVAIEFRGVPGRTYSLNKSLNLDFSIPNSQDSVVLDVDGIGRLEDEEAESPDLNAFYRVEEQ